MTALRSGVAPERVSSAWPVVAAELPDDAAEAGRVPVTFAVRAPAGHDVLLHLNGITDGSREDFEWALLPPVAGPDASGECVHAQAYLLPARLQAGYRIVVADHLPRDAGRSRRTWKRVHEAGRPDALNPGPIMPTPLGGDASLLRLDGAPLHPAWEGPAAANRELGQRPLGAGVTLVDSGRHDALAVVFDAEQWLAVGLLDALGRLSSPPPLLLLVDSEVPGLRDRAGFLPDAHAVAAAVEPALKMLRRTYPGLTRDRVLATGQSFGGLAAVGAVALAGWAGSALAQSASLHYRPPAPGQERPARVEGLGELMQRVIAAGPSHTPGRIELVSGTEEPGMLAAATAAADALRAVGHRVGVRARVGGHDYAWWRHELLLALDRFSSAGSAD